MQDEEYRRLAEVEDDHWYFRALHARIEAALTQALDDRPSRILDAGCGTGGLIRRLSPRHPAWTWTGVDASPVACALARQRCAATIVDGSLLAPPWGGEPFDAIVCADVLYHLENDMGALRALRGALRAGGRLVINVPAHPWLWSYHDVAVAGHRRYTRASLDAVLRAGGFIPEAATHWNTLLLPLIAARRKLWPAPSAGSDVRPPSRLGNALGGAATTAERVLLDGVELPLGSSLFATAH